jgi:hypothetical protein
MPYRGIKRFDELLTLYWGTSFKSKSSDKWRSACEETCGNAAGALFVEEERCREVIVMCASSVNSAGSTSAIPPPSFARMAEENRRGVGQARRDAVSQVADREVYSSSSKPCPREQVCGEEGWREGIHMWQMQFSCWSSTRERVRQQSPATSVWTARYRGIHQMSRSRL